MKGGPRTNGPNQVDFAEAEAGSAYHEPAMGSEVVRLLRPVTGRLYLDGTVGGGGLARLVLEAAPGCRVLGTDRDPEALVEAGRALSPFGSRVRLQLMDFADVAEDGEVRELGLAGAVLDLGVSSHQLDDRGRGFTFRRGVPLDMRFDARARDADDRRPGGDRASSVRTDTTAYSLLNLASRSELTRIFREYGEFRRAAALAAAVVRRRERARMERSDDLVGALASALGRAPSIRDKARVFQAVRIAVNDELGSLRRGLPAIRDALRTEATFVVISYHSLEDRVVKRSFSEWSGACACPPDLPLCACGRTSLGCILTPKPLRPPTAEIDANPRVRSARLRAWKKAA